LSVWQFVRIFICRQVNDDHLQGKGVKSKRILERRQTVSALVMQAARHPSIRYSILSVRRASTASANNAYGTGPSVSVGAGPAGHGTKGPNASQIVDEAVKRVASESPRRRRGLARHSVRLPTALTGRSTSVE
jgi:hypothetical protein